MRELGVALVPIPLDQPTDLEAASAILARERPQALLVHVTPIAVRNLAEIAKRAVAHRLPSVAAYKVMAQGGLLMSYGPPTGWKAGDVPPFTLINCSGAR